MLVHVLKEEDAGDPHEFDQQAEIAALNLTEDYVQEELEEIEDELHRALSDLHVQTVKVSGLYRSRKFFRCVKTEHQRINNLTNFCLTGE